MATAQLSTTSPSCVLFSRTDRAQHNTFSKRKRFQTLVKVLHHCSPNSLRNNDVRGKRTGPDSCACHHQQELCALSWGINKENQKCEIMFPSSGRCSRGRGLVFYEKPATISRQRSQLFKLMPHADKKPTNSTQHEI